MKRIAVLVACYNRQAVTLRNLDALIAGLSGSAVEHKIYLLDDASPDGTGALVTARFPQVEVVVGEGQLYWNRGMRRIFQVAAADGPHDGYLLFNDDVSLDPEAVREFLAIWTRLDAEQPTTLVGATTDSGGSRITYSAMRRRSRHWPFRTEMISPDGELIAADTFNGNFTLIPAATLEALDGPDPHYWHTLGDMDLGYSIAERGERILLAPRPIGTCDDRPPSMRSRHGLRKRLRRGLTGIEDPRERIYFIMKHAPSKPVGVFVAAAVTAKRVLRVALNRGHVLPGSPDARA